MAELVPAAKTSRWPTAHEEASGPEVSVPPSDSHGLQPVPVQARCQRALSWPLANTSIRFGAHEATSGPEARTPPSEFHGVAPVNLVASSFHNSLCPVS